MKNAYKFFLVLTLVFVLGLSNYGMNKFYSYTSNVAQYVGEGAGSVAHQWNCTGCGDCGWTM